MTVNRKPTLMDHTIALRQEVKALREQLTRSSSADTDEEIASAVAEAVALYGNFPAFDTDQGSRNQSWSKSSSSAAHGRGRGHGHQ